MCSHSRRSVLTTLAGLAVALSGGAAAALDPHHAGFVRQVFAMKKIAIDNGDQPFGAVVVRNGDIIGWGPSRVVVNKDPTAHAELEAIRDAQTKLNREDLSDCVMYSTSRPCADCERAAALAHIERLYFGPDATDAGVPNAGISEPRR